MKIAIFHNYMDNIGGSELVCLILARELGADIYTTNVNEKKIRKMGFSTDNIYSLGKVPVNAPFKQQYAYWKFKKLNLRRKYDFYIIGGDWALSGVVNNKPNLWYLYSPMGEIWNFYKHTRKNSVPWFERWIFDLWVLYHRLMTRKNIYHVGKVVSISRNVGNRVEKYFKKMSAVIYPPIETSKFYSGKNGDYWLSVNRLINHKRVEMQIKAFSKIPDEKLIIVGSYEHSKHFKKYVNYIKKIKPDNVEIISWVSDGKLKELYANCKGFITTSIDEDFGMSVVEAMASGKPVIAPNEGGYRETVINGKTGILLDDMGSNKLAKAVKDLGKIILKNPEKYKTVCIEQAKIFDSKVFIEKMKKEIGVARV